jgi:hypothetical protein
MTIGMGELDRANRRRALLDEFETTGVAAGMGRALLEWSGLDPSDSATVAQFAEAIGWSSVPTACREVAATVLVRRARRAVD